MNTPIVISPDAFYGAIWYAQLCTHLEQLNVSTDELLDLLQHVFSCIIFNVLQMVKGKTVKFSLEDLSPCIGLNHNRMAHVSKGLEYNLMSIVTIRESYKMIRLTEHIRQGSYTVPKTAPTV